MSILVDCFCSIIYRLTTPLGTDTTTVTKANVWKITGNPNRGVVFASRVGQVFGWIAIASGVLPLLLVGSFANFWNLLIGFFLLQNARNAAQVALVLEQLTDLTAADLVASHSPIVSGDLTLRELADEQIVSERKWYRYLVTDNDGQLLGAISVDRFRSVPKQLWSETLTKEVMVPIDESSTVQADQPLLEVMQLIEKHKLSALTVIRDNGVLVGILEKTAILSWLQKRMLSNPA